MPVIAYDRAAAVAYAHRWAYGRNPAYANFDAMGGDCTNFASQCLYAGSGVMDFRPTFGWYYRSLNDRSPSWTGVPFFYEKSRLANGAYFSYNNSYSLEGVAICQSKEISHEGKRHGMRSRH